SQVGGVGPGVAGCHAAFEASKSDAKVVLLEEHPQVGVPSHCSGVVSINGLSLLGLKPDPIFTQRTIQGAIFNPPKGEPVEVRTKTPVAVIINRMRFDQHLAKRAVAEGVTLHTKTRVSRFERYPNDGVGLYIQDGPRYKGEIVIDASGAGSRLPEQARLRTPYWNQLL